MPLPQPVSRGRRSRRRSNFQMKQLSIARLRAAVRRPGLAIFRKAMTREIAGRVFVADLGADARFGGTTLSVRRKKWDRTKSMKQTMRLNERRPRSVATRELQVGEARLQPSARFGCSASASFHCGEICTPRKISTIPVNTSSSARSAAVCLWQSSRCGSASRISGTRLEIRRGTKIVCSRVRQPRRD